MAARSRAIESRLERLAPSLEELYVAGIVTLEERNSVARTRMMHEYKLVARPLLANDVKRAIDFEQTLEDKIAAFTSGNKVQLKHRWAVLDRIESIFIIAVGRLREGERRALEDDFLAFLRRVGRNDALSRYLAERVSKFPQEPRYWCLAAEWDNELGNSDHARATIQRAVELLPASPAVWICAVHVELGFADRALSQIRADSANKGSKASALRNENAALGAVLLDLTLARTVVSAALSSAAASSELLIGLVDCALRVPFARSVALHAVHAAFAAHSGVCPLGAADVLFKIASKWHAVCDPEAFVESCKLKEPSLETGLAAMDALAVACPEARQQMAKAVLHLFPVSPSPAVSALLSTRFVAGDWTLPTKDAVAGAAFDVVAACLPETLPSKPATVDPNVVGQMRKQGLCDASSADCHLLQLLDSGDFEGVRADVAKRTPKRLEDWKQFVARVRLGATARKQRTRDDDSDSDDEHANRGPSTGAAAAREGLLFLAHHSQDSNIPWRKAALTEAASEMTRWGTAAVVASALNVSIEDALTVSLGSRPVSALSLVVDGMANLVAPLETLVIGSSAAIREHVIPKLVDIAQTTGSSLHQRAIVLARRYYDILAKRDKLIVEEYAKFEIEVAKRPDFAASVRRRLR